MFPCLSLCDLLICETLGRHSKRVPSPSAIVSSGSSPLPGWSVVGRPTSIDWHPPPPPYRPLLSSPSTPVTNLLKPPFPARGTTHTTRIHQLSPNGRDSDLLAGGDQASRPLVWQFPSVPLPPRCLPPHCLRPHMTAPTFRRGQSSAAVGSITSEVTVHFAAVDTSH